MDVLLFGGRGRRAVHGRFQRETAPCIGSERNDYRDDAEDHDRCEDQCAAHYAVLHETVKCGRQKCDECSDPGDADSRQQYQFRYQQQYAHDDQRDD